jgi:hypothetical protein
MARHRYWASQEAAVTRELPQQCPGFVDAIYRRAFSEGWTINRW